MAPPFRKLSMDELARPTAEAHRLGPRLPIVLVLDDLRSHHNIGALFRTADAFNVQRMVLCGITGTPPHRDIHKTALGATESVPWTYAPQALAAVSELRTKGYTICALEQTTGSTDLRQLAHIITPNTPLALILGNEVNGVNEALLPLCNHCIEIPQSGAKHSLNVSVAGGVALWELYRLYTG
jgi:tRNA G18 (ribose-2'-O)-methylase SpoU